MDKKHDPFTALDGVAIAATLFVVFWNFKIFSLFPPEFYTGMGKELPTMTTTVYSWWFKLIAFAIPLGVLWSLFLPKVKASINTMRIVIIAAFVLACSMFSITVMGIYSPIFDMASGI